MHANRIIFFSFLVFFSSFADSSEFSLPSIIEHAKKWSLECAQELPPKDLKIVIDFLYLLYANALLDSEIQRCYEPLLELSHKVRNNLADPLNPNKELSYLKKLADEIETITTMRLFYTQLLDEYLDYYDRNKNDHLEQKLHELQLYESQALHTWAHEQQVATDALLEKSAKTLVAFAQNMYATANLYTGLSQQNLPFSVEEKNKSLAIFNVILKNATPAMAAIDNASNTLNTAADHAMNIICLGTQIYREHYRTLYQTIHAHELFDSFCLSIPQEHALFLPDINPIIEFD